VQEIFLLLTLVQGCGFPVTSPARRAGLVISADSLARHLSDPDVVVVHLEMMSDERYRGGHVPGARLADPHRFVAATNGASFELPPIARLDSLIESLGIGNNSRVVLYGDPGHLGRVFLALEYAGLAGRVAVLDGGLTAWRAGSRPVETTSAPPRRATFTPRPDASIVIGTDELRRRLGDRRLALIDARNTAEYSGGEVLGGTRGGHLAGARLIDWSLTFEDASAVARENRESRLASDAVLRRLFTDARVTSDRELVVYCTIGMRAAHLYFVARYLGYNPRIYDGSIEVWSRANLPLTTGDRP
jgi:thiosulfate/3-mercaptopyruvate sulfurtransferase